MRLKKIKWIKNIWIKIVSFMPRRRAYYCLISIKETSERYNNQKIKYKATCSMKIFCLSTVCKMMCTPFWRKINIKRLHLYYALPWLATTVLTLKKLNLCFFSASRIWWHWALYCDITFIFSHLMFSDLTRWEKIDTWKKKSFIKHTIKD